MPVIAEKLEGMIEDAIAGRLDELAFDFYFF